MYFKSKQLILGMGFTKRLVLAFGVVWIMGLCGCQQDDDTIFEEENTPQPEAFTMTAKMNGTGWVGTQNVSELIKNSSSTPSKEMRISVNSKDLKLLNITIQDGSTGIAGDGIAVKTYTFSATGTSDAEFTLINNNPNGGTYIGAYGSISITKSDAANKKLTGTFSCTLAQKAGDTLRITNGIIKDLTYTIDNQ